MTITISGTQLSSSLANNDVKKQGELEDFAGDFQTLLNTGKNDVRYDQRVSNAVEDMQTLKLEDGQSIFGQLSVDLHNLASNSPTASKVATTMDKLQDLQESPSSAAKILGTMGLSEAARADEIRKTKRELWDEMGDSNDEGIQQAIENGGGLAD